MPTEVLATPRAEQQIGRLSRKQSKAFENFLNDLATRGCRALAYRLSGQAPIDHLCVKHLSGSLRVVVAFDTPHRAWILLAGPHDDQDPILNVYAELYRLLDAEPQPDAGRHGADLAASCAIPSTPRKREAASLRLCGRLIGAALKRDRWLFALQDTVGSSWHAADPVLRQRAGAGCVLRARLVGTSAQLPC